MYKFQSIYLKINLQIGCKFLNEEAENYTPRLIQSL